MYQIYDFNSAAKSTGTMDFERAKTIAETVVRNAPAGHESAYLLIVGENDWALRFGDIGAPVKLYGSEIPRTIRQANKPE